MNPEEARAADNKFKIMTQSLRAMYSDEQVGDYLKWIIGSGIAQDHYRSIHEGEMLLFAEWIRDNLFKHSGQDWYVDSFTPPYPDYYSTANLLRIFREEKFKGNG